MAHGIGVKMICVLKRSSYGSLGGISSFFLLVPARHIRSDSSFPLLQPSSKILLWKLIASPQWLRVIVIFVGPGIRYRPRDFLTRLSWCTFLPHREAAFTLREAGRTRRADRMAGAALPIIMQCLPSWLVDEWSTVSR